MLHPINKRKLRKYKIDFCGEETTVYLMPMNYSNNGTLAIEMCTFDEELHYAEPFGHLTKNLCDPRQSATRAFVKTYGENEGWAEELADRIGRKTGHEVRSGYIAIPLYEFDLERCYE